MEATVNTLEALFQKADSDLNYVALKLESEFTQQFADIGEEELNPIIMLERIRKAKTEATSLMKEATEIHSEQQEIQTFVSEHLLACQDLLRSTEARAGVEVSGRTPDENVLSSLLRKNHSSSQQDIPSDSASTNQKLCDKENQSTSNSIPQGETLKAMKDFGESAAEPTKPSKADRRANTGEFTPVDEEEFTSVSSLIRGRVKLQDVNKVYEFLYNHFKKNKKSPALTPPDMTKMGQKVTGATGEAKLKVLRALKILEISNKGAVKLIS